MEKVQLMAGLQTVDCRLAKKLWLGASGLGEQILAISLWHCQAKAIWVESQFRAKGLRFYFENRAPPSGHLKADF